MFQYPERTKIVEQKGNMATFEVSPLYPGYGATIGNVMRRTLISSLEGAAVTAVKIKGIDHEFTSIPGVMQDVIDIILNLKKIRFKMYKDEPIELNLNVKGQKTVTAGDIKTTADVEVVNKDQEIATITDKKTELEMAIVVEKGVGYIPVEQRQKTKLSVGEIAIDGIFTPVVNVNFRVENIRVGQRTDYNKVLIDIETDGSVTPQEAFDGAVKIIAKHFEIMENGSGNKAMPGKIVEESVELEEDEAKEIMKIDDAQVEDSDQTVKKSKKKKSK